MAFDQRERPVGTRAEIRMGDAALFLDLDGTLATLEPTPDAVGPDEVRSELLRRARDQLDGRLAVVSGRTLAEIDRILEAVTPCAAGVHGLERRGAGGSLITAEPHAAVNQAEAALRAYARRRPGLLVESKSLSVALHFRGSPEEHDGALALARSLAAGTGLTLQEGHQVVELRTPGPDKGDAVRAFMAEPPFAGARPIFAGDDLTDEAAFAAVQALGGIGVLVGPPRPSKARGTLAGVPAVFDWLDRSLRSGVFKVEYGPWGG